MSTPKVFISYSHDSPEHKIWVMKLGEKLLKHGVEVLLDAWELKPGVDLSLFMERSLREADRVLMICTPNYVAKAEEGRGGVGYEKTIMTAEYMKSVDSIKVIPIIRQKSATHVPAFLATKIYLDFSTDELAEYYFDELVRELHGKPLYLKPKLGAAPNFDITPIAEPKLSEDPILKAMKIIVDFYESEDSGWTKVSELIAHAQAVGMSKIYFEMMLDEVESANLIERNRYGYLTLSSRGRKYAIENQLV